MKENPRNSLDKLIKKFSEIEIKRQKSIVTGKFGLGVRNEAGQRLIEFCQENALVIANTPFQQHKRRLCMWISPYGQLKSD